MKKTVALQQDSRLRVNKMTLGKLGIQLTYDSNENISSVTFDAQKKDMPTDETILRSVIEMNSIWGSVLRSTKLINSQSAQDTNSITSTTAQSAGTIRLIQISIDQTVGGTQITVIAPTTPINGDVIFAAIGTWSNAASRTVTSITQAGVTWTKIGNLARFVANYNAMELWKGVVSPGASATTVINLSGSAIGAAILTEWALGVGTLDKSATNFNDAYQTVWDAGTTAATTTAYELWVAVIEAENTMSTPTNGFTLVDGVTLYSTVLGLGFLYKITSATGAANTQTTGTANSPYLGLIATFKSA